MRHLITGATVRDLLFRRMGVIQLVAEVGVVVLLVLAVGYTRSSGGKVKARLEARLAAEAESSAVLRARLTSHDSVMATLRAVRDTIYLTRRATRPAAVAAAPVLDEAVAARPANDSLRQAIVAIQADYAACTLALPNCEERAARDSAALLDARVTLKRLELGRDSTTREIEQLTRRSPLLDLWHAKEEVAGLGLVVGAIYLVRKLAK